MRHAVCLLAFAMVAGCYTYPCDQDVLACEHGDALAIDESCEVDTELTVELLEVDEGAWPIVHHGVQGGVHFTLALGIAGLDAVHAQVQLDVAAFECTDAESSNAPADCSTMAPLAERTLVADDAVLESGPESHELHDVVVLLEREPDSGGELVIEAMDACGRTAALVHEVTN